MDKKFVVKLALAVAVVGIAAAIVTVVFKKINEPRGAAVVQPVRFHHNPLVGHETEVFKLLYLRDRPDPKDGSTWAESQKYYFNINTFLQCYIPKNGLKKINQLPAEVKKAMLDDCKHMASIERAFAKQQGKFTTSTVNDWLDQRVLKVLFERQQARLRYEDTH